MALDSICTIASAPNQKWPMPRMALSRQRIICPPAKGGVALMEFVPVEMLASDVGGKMIRLDTVLSCRQAAFLSYLF